MNVVRVRQWQWGGKFADDCGRYVLGPDVALEADIDRTLALFPYESVLLDLKLQGGAADVVDAFDAAAAFSPVWAVTVHAGAGRGALEAVRDRASGAVRAVADVSLAGLDDADCRAVYGTDRLEAVFRLVRRADALGFTTFLCRPEDEDFVRRNLDDPARVELISITEDENA